ncbi:MAG: CBS domain-containing protein [Acidobacteriota bacterium]|nr:MAG: CBS domain-containing protein [Acidobacteriota bacterium]
MGEHEIRGQLSGEQHRAFMRCLLRDLRALEYMIGHGMIESGVRRIGAEQEMFLVDRSWRPAPTALEVLGLVDDPHFTTELARFNLEVNLDPLTFGGDCLSRMERQLQDLLERAQEAASAFGTQIMLAGILPTLRKSDLGLENMTPMPRYFSLNRAMSSMRGGAYEFHIRGVDELLVKHDSVLVEACNASFQVHFQVGAEEFARLYNIAQLVAAPVLAISTNSPLLFGKRLWRETRIALFQQAVDTRSTHHHLRERSPRVSFGRKWIDESVIELFKEDIARFRVLISTQELDNPLKKLEQGEVPELKALRLHNGTVYRWNRACYGVSNGKPHLRIENRVMPSGPSIVDEIANAAVWYGLIAAFTNMDLDPRQEMEFAEAVENFHAAARLGLSAEFHWRDGETYPARDLTLRELLPMARQGLADGHIAAEDIDRYLGIVEERVRSRNTGSRWILSSLAGMKEKGTTGERLNAITAATLSRQATDDPVHRWEPARLAEAGGWKHNYLKVEQFMTTDLFTVHDDEPIDLVANLMEWEHIRHVPVEDHQNRLVGLVSYRALLRLLARGHEFEDKRTIPVAEVMRKELITISPETTSLEAMELMEKHQIGCVPVVKDERLVGIVTERDFMDIAGELLEEKLKED